MAAPGTRKLTLTVAGTEMAPEVTSARVVVEDGDADPTFSEAAAGGVKVYKLVGTAVQDPGSTTSLWYQIWQNSGTDVAVVVRPYGNTTPTVAQPHFTGTVTLSAPSGDFLGGDADPSNTQRWTFDFEFTFTAKPTRVTA